MKCCIRGLLNQVDYVSWFTFPMFRSFFYRPKDCEAHTRFTLVLILIRARRSHHREAWHLISTALQLNPSPVAQGPVVRIRHHCVSSLSDAVSVISGFPRQHSVRALLGETSEPKTTNDKCQATLAMTADICESSTEKTLDFDRYLERSAWLLGQFWRR